MLAMDEQEPLILEGITVYIAKSEDFPNIADTWSMTTIGFHFTDTYQDITRKAL